MRMIDNDDNILDGWENREKRVLFKAMSFDGDGKEVDIFSFDLVLFVGYGIWWGSVDDDVCEYEENG